MLVGQREEDQGIFSYLRVLQTHRENKSDGLSVVELMVVVFILGVVITALFFALTRGEFSSAVSFAKADLQAKVRRITDWIVKDVREANLIEINTNEPSVNHIKFRKVAGIDNSAGNYTLTPNFIEYNYDEGNKTLTRNEIDSDNAILQSWIFNNITQPPFYIAIGDPLDSGDILDSKKLIVVVAAENKVRNSLTLNFSLTEEVKIRNE